MNNMFKMAALCCLFISALGATDEGLRRQTVSTAHSTQSKHAFLCVNSVDTQGVLCVNIDGEWQHEPAVMYDKMSQKHILMNTGESILPFGRVVLLFVGSKTMMIHRNLAFGYCILTDSFLVSCATCVVSGVKIIALPLCDEAPADALVSDYDTFLQRVWPVISSCYFGGGFPSHSAREISRTPLLFEVMSRGASDARDLDFSSDHSSPRSPSACPGVGHAVLQCEEHPDGSLFTGDTERFLFAQWNLPGELLSLPGTPFHPSHADYSSDKEGDSAINRNEYVGDGSPDLTESYLFDL
jgi:hypothetical protein